MKKIYNIPAGENFPGTLAEFLLEQAQDNPERLAQYRVLLPTRRACRVLRDAFLQLTGGRPMILPRMASIGDVEEQDLSLLMFDNRHEILDIPPAISALRRQLLLARLVIAVPEFAQGKVHALSLANALSRFMDKVVVEGLDFAKLHKIVPEEFASHWQITLEFLKIVGEEWPNVLRAENCVDVADRRNILLHALAGYLRNVRPENPIVVAGTTGSIPATRHLLSVISDLPQGQIVLPGLDLHMDEESWNILAENHPQYGLKNLLETLGVDRKTVKTVGRVNDQTVLRGMLATEIMRPAQTSHMWKKFSEKGNMQDMLAGLQYYVCDTQQEEAQVISILIREILEQEGRTVALVTPDRKLARRVVALCLRWGIKADDSAGEILSDSRAGQFLLLCLKAASAPLDQYALLAFLKHVLCHAGYRNDIYHDFVHKFETEFLRSKEGVYSYETLMETVGRENKNDPLAVFIEKIYEGLSGLIKFTGVQKKAGFADILRAHIKACEFFAEIFGEDEADILWRGDDGETAVLFLNDLQDHADDIGDVSYEEYEEIFSHFASQSTVRSPYGLHPRLSILGQIEARLTSADLIIMSGLNEGTWPSLPAHDPWMSKAMRKDFGLPTDERSIGLAAHDFVQAFCAKNVVMTRSCRIDGSPVSPARWLQRLDTVLKAGGKDLSVLSGAPHLAWARKLDWTEEFSPCERPRPCPPLSVRPDRVSVTKVENWLRDPYMIYAYYIMNLRKLNPLTHQTDATTKGKILHGILERFHRACPYDLPPEAEEIMVACAKEELKASGIPPEALGFWWPRFYRLCSWFISHERAWRERAKFLKTEAKGEIALAIDGRPFSLHGIADRIDRMHGGYAIIDYKSGGSFTGKAMKGGKLPQLPLEALIIQHGGFEGVEVGDTQYMGYWKMTGGVKAGELTEIEEGVDDIVKVVQEGLVALVRAFCEPDMPFLSIPDPANAPRFNDYEHLARVKEWTALDNDAQEWEE